MSAIEIPGYVVKREISTTSSATVLLAEQTSLDREVALKILAPSLASDKAHADRFLQVARTLASFSHPNIVAVYDVGVASGETPYFSMQFLSGGDFFARAQRGIDEPDLTETVASIARALGYVHQRGLIHRAVTPQNVLYDGYNTPILIDFGVAPAATQESYVTSAGFAVDAGRYMSPEQARGGELTARSDIYSLGALCFIGLTGRPPYDGADGFAVAYAHVFEPIPRLPANRAHWQALIDRALAKDPKDRYADVDEFLEALTRIGTEQAPEPAAPAATAAAVADAPLVTAAADVPVPAEPTPAPAQPAPTREPAVTVAAVRTPKPEPRVSALKPPAKPTGAATAATDKAGWMRAWPLFVVVGGVALIAAALLIPRGESTKAVSEPQPTAVELPATSTAPGASPDSSTAAAAGPSTTSGIDQPSVPAETTAPVQPDAGAPLPDAGTAAGSETISTLDTLEAATAPTVVDPLNEAIRLGRIDLAGQRLTSPPGSNALERFQFALKLEPKSRSAKQGIVDVAKKYMDLADRNPPDKAAGIAGLIAYGQMLDRAADVAKLLPEGADVLKELATRRRKAVEPLIAQAKADADAWNKAGAKSVYEQALQIDPDNTAARDGLKFVATIGEPGFVFRDKLADGAQAPPLVVLPGASLAMARHPVTRAEFRRFWDSAGRSAFAGKEPTCRDRESIFRSSKKRSWENPDVTQDDTHPVVCVSWPQAAAYAQWLAKQTGKRYRLPSAAEVNQLASRAPRADCATTNLADAAFNRQFAASDGSACDDGFAATSPVEHFAPVEGVYDVDGNVREWVGACGNGAVATAGSSCRDFRVAGRSWLSAAKESVTFSDTYAGDVSLNTVGFRVARDMAN